MRPRLWLVCLLALVVLAGCRLPSTPDGAVHPKEEELRPALLNGGAVYLASLVAVDINLDYGLPLLIGPNVSTFPEGRVEFWVLNKWGGLTTGPRVDTVRILSPDGREVLDEQTTEFNWLREHFTVTTAKPFALDGLAPGIYPVEILLDGVPVLRYGFRVVAEADW
jgi:hypothetical protein